ncbi:MAG: L-2-hydroxyglutarate oxidase [Thermoleophilaceae bacterium]
MEDFVVVGGGIVGLAVARELLARHPGASLVVREREAEVGLHQTGRNSGVVHAGIYYAPGSLKARLCVAGARELYDYCAARGIPAQRSGKLIVALDESELPALDELERRGRANGVPGLRRLSAAELREVEPHAAGMAALHSPETGVVDFGAVARALREDVEGAGGRVMPASPVEEREVRAGLGARFAVFCAGAAADRLAVAAGADPDPRIVPFRGAYLRLRPGKARLVRSMIYPVPDPALPFLGVHLTRRLDGEVLAGPTALLLPRARSLAWPGTWRMMRRFWRPGLSEARWAARRGAYAREVARYLPGVEPGDLEPAFTGVRAQALGRDGRLVDDFAVSETPGALHVRNAPSPAATSSLALARLVADRVEAAIR